MKDNGPSSYKMYFLKKKYPVIGLDEVEVYD